MYIDAGVVTFINVVTDGLHPMVIGTSRGRKFTERDAFIGYQKDTPAAVVSQAIHLLKGEGPVVSSQEWGRMEQVSIPAPKAKEEEEAEKDWHVWKEDVSTIPKYHIAGTLVSAN